jgi:hypothetical protein
VVFEEARAIEPTAEMFVKGVRICAMIATRYLDANAPVRPGKLLRRGYEQAAHTVLAKIGRDNQTRNPTKKTIGMKPGDAMKRNNTDHLSCQLGNQNGGVGRILAIDDTLLNSCDGRGITESGH